MSQKRQDWVEMLLNDHTEGTTMHYRSWADRFEDWREWSGQDPSEDILDAFDDFLTDPDEMRAFREEYVDAHSAWNQCRIPSDGYAYRTRVKAVSAAKSFVDYVYEVEFPNRQRFKVNNIVAGEAPAFDPIIASSDEVIEIFEAAKDCKSDAAFPMVRLGYDAIMRSAEIVRVKWDHLNLKRGTIWVDSAKGSPKRHVKLSPKTLEVLTEYREFVKEQFDNPEWLFYRFQGYRWNNRWTPNAWSTYFRKHLWSGGWHAFGRHTAITSRLNAGESLTDVSRRARHANIENTIKYDQLSDNGKVPPELQ